MDATQASREALAAALSTVDGVDGHPSRPPIPSTGQAWPTWVSRIRFNGCTFSDTFYCWLVVSAADEESTVAFAHSVLTPVWHALETVCDVVSAEGLVITLEGPSGLPVVRYTVTILGSDEQ